MRWCLVLVLVSSCGTRAGGSTSGDDDDAPMLDAMGTGPGNLSAFDPAVTNVDVEIDYETGQQPFTGPILGFGDTFDPTQANVDRLFAGKKVVTIPRALGAMEDIGAVD